MKNKIQILPDAVKRKIAAGEVIDGPYSVVKELLENSIDAQAAKIDIEIIDSGFKRIAVKDNGTGMYKDDIPLSIEEHATSKINNIEDIYEIFTMGFRGEALSSIAEVSQTTIMSRSPDEQLGGKLITADGKKELFDWAGQPGTAVIVENLFFNTPARKKFTKGMRAELNRIKDTIFAIAIAHPHVAFNIAINNQSIVLQSCDVLQRIEQIYGKELAGNLLYDSLADLDCTVGGYASQPEYFRSNRSLQFLYVNKRPIQFSYFNMILHQVYQTILQKGQHPAAFIFCDIKPERIDVNVHPAKREIRFFDANYIHSLLYNFVNKIISKNVHAIRLKDNRIFEHAIDLKPVSSSQHNSHHNNDYSLPLMYPHHSVNRRHDVIKEISNVYTQIHGTHSLQYEILGVAFGTYFVLQQNDELYFIDYHAAHERKLFDHLISVKSVAGVQQLLIPAIVELTPDLLLIMHNYNDILRNYGLSVEQFDDTSVVVNAIPDFCDTSNIEGLLKDIADSLLENRNSIEDIKIKIIEKIACHSAKKSNDTITNDDIIALADYVFSCNNYRCPHGRPFVYALSKYELERFFKRT